ncbi:MAG: DUF1080 domain-containing protein [Terricaulis sp.]
MSTLSFGRIAACIAAVFLTFAAPAQAQTAPWRDLVRGDSTDGWRTLGGTAQFTIENGEVVGHAVLGSANTFLATRETFGDFILEYELKSDARVNSGVQIRSESVPTYRNGVVHGYQVESDPSARAWSGGLYDEQRRQWLYTLIDNPTAQAAFNVGDWNHFRVEAIGNRIRTWVNGVPAANVLDDMTPRGFIALQVHSIPNDPALVGLETRFRNIRILTRDLARYASPLNDAIEEQNYIANTVTERQAAQGWRLLWDGRTTNGWRGARLPGFPDHGWSIRDGLLSVEPSGGAESRNGGDIITTEDFSNFDLELDFRVAPGGNSGIKYFVDPELLRGEGSAIGLEYQILDDERHPDAQLGVAGNRTLASLYDLIPATGKRANPPGEWNRARIIVRGNHVEHRLNGGRVVEYERGTQIFRALVAYSKYKDWPHFGELPAGPILLQDHGDAVSFRSIRIRTLPAE